VKTERKTKWVREKVDYESVEHPRQPIPSQRGQSTISRLARYRVPKRTRSPGQVQDASTLLTTMHALHYGSLFQLRFGYPANAGRPLIVHILGLNTSDAAELFVSVPARPQWAIVRGQYDMVHHELDE
jgi:hypothetical protein